MRTARAAWLRHTEQAFELGLKLLKVLIDATLDDSETHGREAALDVDLCVHSKSRFGSVRCYVDVENGRQPGARELIAPDGADADIRRLRDRFDDDVGWHFELERPDLLLDRRLVSCEPLDLLDIF